MKPVNRDNNSGVNASSNTVVYDGPDIKCLGICRGQTLTEDVCILANKLCEVLEDLNVSEYDLSCFDLQHCAPKDFIELIQLLIDRICALEGIENPTTGGTKGCPDCTVNMSQCFYYTDPKTGDTVTTSQLTDYVALLGNTICELLLKLNFTVSGLQNQGGRLSVVESKVSALETQRQPLPTITPVCVLSSSATIDIVLQALEKQFCELRAATGTPSEIFSAAGAQPSSLGTQRALGTQGGTMDSIPGWQSVVKTLSDSINNMWLTITDLRSAVTNIQQNCCPSPCNGISVRIQAALSNPNTLILYFTGTIPSSLTECGIAGTQFTIADQSGHSINITIPLVSNMNNPSGYPVTLSGTPLNTADNFTISSTLCFKDSVTQTVCESCLEYVFVNTINCPIVGYIPSSTSVNFSFAHTTGTITYTVSLYDSTGTILLQSISYPETSPATISGTFNGLVPGTTYKAKVSMISGGVTTVCPFSVFTTLPDACPSPKSVSAVITIP